MDTDTHKQGHTHLTSFSFVVDRLQFSCDTKIVGKSDVTHCVSACVECGSRWAGL